MNKFFKLIIWPIILIPFAYLAITYNQLPAQLAMQFDLTGTPTRFGSKNELWIFLLIITMVSLAVYFLLPAAYKIDPKKSSVRNKPALHRMALVISIFLAVISCMIISTALQGNIRPNIRFVFGTMGLMWCLLGNYMYNLKPNNIAGMRLPWTLNDEDNWKRTHWMAAKLWFAGGFFTFLLALFAPVTIMIVAAVVIAIVTTVIPAVYSYQLHTKRKAVH